MKNNFAIKQETIYNLFLTFLCIQGALSLNGAVAVKKKNFQKSLLPLYQTDIAENAPCVTCKMKTCHAQHSFCQICTTQCDQCDKDCKDCHVECFCARFHGIDKDQKEVVLDCNHVFGEQCIKEWEATSPHGDCPNCRRKISYKTCALCKDSVYEWDKACTFECTYWSLGWKKEQHVFHSRCIVSYARKTAFISDRDIGPHKKGDIVFHCPALHKSGSHYAKIHLKVALDKVIHSNIVSTLSFPSQADAESKDLCALCHKTITGDEKKCSYLCEYEEVPWREDMHHFHESCLKPYVERNAYKQKQAGTGAETGKIVFICPVDHSYGVWYPHRDLEREILPGFKPECIIRDCAICHEEVNTDDDDTVKIEYREEASLKKAIHTLGLQEAIEVEVNYYHSRCFGKFAAEHAYRQKTLLGIGEMKAFCPCPRHMGTKWAHLVELDKNHVDLADN